MKKSVEAPYSIGKMSAKSKQSKKFRRRRDTWTFQPDDDVVELVLKRFGNLSRGERTRLVNEAIRLKHAEAALSLAERALDEAQARVDALKGKASGSG